MFVFNRPRRQAPAMYAALFMAGVFAVREIHANDQIDQASSAEYILAYPVAERFCPPIRTYFFDIEQTIQKVGRRTIRHQLNGGYGLPVRRQVGGQNLLHLGADVGWYRVGEPVFCVGDGVVRVSEGSPLPSDKKGAGSREAMFWGNLVVIEHRLPTDEYALTIYGHLGNERLVEAGQMVQAGQQIGTIGRQHVNVNGGYKPHLHFGVREGRFAEVGDAFLAYRVGESIELLRISAVAEEHVELDDENKLAGNTLISTRDRQFELNRVDGKLRVSSTILHQPTYLAAKIVGYGLSTDGWLDPTKFLREQRADLEPAPFSIAPATD